MGSDMKHLQRHCAFFVVLVVLLAWRTEAAERGEQAAARQLRAGAATSNITPVLGSPIVGGWNDPPAERIHDELHVRCLVLDDGATKLAFAVCDNVGIPREIFDTAKHLIHGETGILVENMLMSATHTHTGTSARWSNNLKPS